MEKALSRRGFIGQVTGTALAGTALFIVSCGKARSAEAFLAPNPSDDMIGEIANNHGHEVIVSGEAFDANQPITINIHAAASHPHEVSLTPEQLEDMLAGEEVVVESSETGFHSTGGIDLPLVYRHYLPF